MIDLIVQTWWLLLLLVGVIAFAIGFPLTSRLLFTGKWANWFFIFTLALTGFGILSLSSAAGYIYIQPVEEILVDIPPPPPPEPGEFVPAMTLEGVYAATANVSLLFFKPPVGYLFLILLGVFVFKIIADDLLHLIKRKV